jgi:ATP-dependent Clp protease adaptor protein ClpS
MSNKRENKPDDGRPNGLAIEEAKPKVKKPRLYRVLLINDDFTPMEFVVTVLEQFFQMPRETAVRVMLNVHQKGMGVCGVFTVEIAELKVRQVLDYAQEHQHPLQCTMEPD